jgi:hypothetical protein
MAKKKADEPTTEDKGPEQPATPEPGTTRTGVDMLPADREVLQGTLEERGAALDKDLQRMSVR